MDTTIQEFIKNVDIQELLNEGIHWIIKYAILIILAILVFRVGLRLIKRIMRSVDRAMTRARFDKGLKLFLHGTVNLLLKVFLVIIIAGIIGVPASSFLAVLGAAGLAVGLALQGSLANFAGGILILLFKPFKVGEYIEGQGVSGTVEKISVFATTLTTVQNQMVSIPNGQLANGNIINYSRLKKRRIDINVGVSYDTDLKKAREILLPLLEKHPKILHDPQPEVLVDGFGDNSVNLIVRGFLPTEEYRDAYYALLEQTKEALDDAGIEIPFPQRVLYMKKGG